MGRKSTTPSERRRYAEEASRSGDAAVARKLGLSQRTVANWRRTHGLALKSRSQTRAPDVPSGPLGLGLEFAASDLETNEEAVSSGSIPPGSDGESALTLADIDASVGMAPFESNGVLYESTDEFLAHLESQPHSLAPD